MFLEKNCCVSFFGSNWLLRIFQAAKSWKFMGHGGNSQLWVTQISGSAQWLWGCHEKTVFMECGKVFLVKISQLWFIPYIIDFGFSPLERRVLGTSIFTTPERQVSRTTQWPGHWRYLILIRKVVTTTPGLLQVGCRVWSLYGCFLMFP